MSSVGKYNETYFSTRPEEAAAPGVLYCVVLVNKKTQDRECLKIGITKGTSHKDVLKRASGFSGYEIRIQKIKKGTLVEVFRLEQQLHAKWQHKKFTEPSNKFGGWTELFHFDREIIQSIV